MADFLGQVRRIVLDVGSNRLQTGSSARGAGTGDFGGEGASGSGAEAGGGGGTDVDPDLTPPPDVEGLAVVAGISQVSISWDAPAYAQGRGNKRTILYAVKQDPTETMLPTFPGDAGKVDEVSELLNLRSLPSEPNTRWHVWAKFESNDGVLSVNPAGGINGAQDTTAQDVTLLLDVLTGQITESQLFSSLGARINLIDAPATGLVTKVSGLEAAVGSTVSAAQSASAAAAAEAAAILAQSGAQTASASASQAAADAVTAKVAAITAQTGAETAEDNAVIAKTSAETAASNASTSATGASNSATGAAGSASSASTSATNAATSATNSGNSANAASTSASSANTFATNAATASTAANTAKVAAESARDAASGSAAAASTSASTATTKATEASQSATSAATSATTATTKASEASTSASQASTSATNAAGSSSSAATSATNAAGSANAAGTSASNASTSATQSAASATNAAGSASTATTQATTATGSATAAGQSATAASTSATNAATSATSAGTSSTAANTAKVAAESARDAASGSAAAASTSASTATTKATEASQSATSAATSATNAGTSASTALTYQNNASSSASNAQGYSNSAATSATAAANSLSQVQATATGFDSAVAWNFDGGLEGWAAANATISNVSGSLRLTSSGTDPQVRTPYGLSVAGSVNSVIRARVKRLSGAGWDGSAYYSTSGHGDSDSYRKIVANSTVLNEWRVIEWDMAALSSGGSDWTSNVITNIRLDLGASASDSFDIDWVAVGRIAPVAYSAAVQQEATARANADGTLFAQYTVKVDTSGYVSGFGLASTAVNAVPYSTFAIRADKFYVASPSGPGITPIVPFVVNTSPVVEAGVTIPAGVYMDGAYIRNLTAMIARFGSASIDSAKIGNLDAAKITTGTLTGITINGVTINGTTITGGLLQTAATGARVVVAEGGSTTLRVYSNLGSGVILTSEVGAITNSAGFPNARFGQTGVANLTDGVLGLSGSGSGVNGKSWAGFGVHGGGYSTSSIAVRAEGYGAGLGLWASSSSRAIKSDGALSVAFGTTIHDPYGTVSVTRDTVASYSYYGMTRNGQQPYSMGIDTDNAWWFGVGTSGHNSVLNQRYLTIGGNYVIVAGAFGCNGKGAQSSYAVNGPSSDLATAIALVNQLRQALVNNGICG